MTNESQIKIVDCVQLSPEWFAAKLGKVSASSFDRAIAGGQGKTRRTYMLQLIAEIMTGKQQDSYCNDNMKDGTELECYAREHYEIVNNCKVVQVGFVLYDENIGCSPDGLVGDDGLVEIKCPLATTHILTILDDSVPTGYIPQIQGQMWVTGRQWADFVSFSPEVSQRPYWCKRVTRDDKYISELKVKIDVFVQEMQNILKQLKGE